MDELCTHLDFGEERIQIWVAVPFTALHSVQEKIENKPVFRLGAQNMNDARPGAFTGEIAAEMLKEAEIIVNQI
jgi:triosephosphate isomerase